MLESRSGGRLSWSGVSESKKSGWLLEPHSSCPTTFLYKVGGQWPRQKSFKDDTHLLKLFSKKECLSSSHVKKYLFALISMFGLPVSLSTDAEFFRIGLLYCSSLYNVIFIILIICNFCRFFQGQSRHHSHYLKKKKQEERNTSKHFCSRWFTLFICSVPVYYKQTTEKCACVCGRVYLR